MILYDETVSLLRAAHDVFSFSELKENLHCFCDCWSPCVHKVKYCILVKFFQRGFEMSLLFSSLLLFFLSCVHLLMKWSYIFDNVYYFIAHVEMCSPGPAVMLF